MGLSQVVAVAGTHGKSTTSSMISVMFDQLGRNPSSRRGHRDRRSRHERAPGRAGAPTRSFVAEADESDGLCALPPGYCRGDER